MKGSCKLCWLVSLVLVAALGAMSYFFLIKGNVIVADDGRTAILMSAEERDLVLGEMRGFLEAIQGITTGISENDMGAVAQNASAVGMLAAAGTPPALMAKLPLEFKKLGFATHTAFDDLAQEANDMGDGAIVLAKTGALLARCTSCHAGYRFDIESN